MTLNDLEATTVPSAPDPEPKTSPHPQAVTHNENKLFVYGIFLGQDMRVKFGMTNPQYATVRDYLTIGGQIVQARKVLGCGLSLTGLLVDVDPKYWASLDSLEAGYDRRRVTTTSGSEAWIYTSKRSI
jgi:gamma-glutamylcyclotransferase (GGCT)/AIG2-like uncharacterized protein YtfP